MSSCPHQRLAGISVKTGKLTFDCRAFQPGTSFYVSCGKCFICRRSHAFEWSVRIRQEALKHKFFYFGTLTYADKFLVHSDIDVAGELCKSDWRSFMRDLRYYHNREDHLSFVHAGEYGSRSGRAHDHFILFSDFPVLESEIRRAWHDKGIIDFQICGDSAPGYVASYTTKKLLGRQDLQHRVPEYISCSPGIGKRWLMDHLEIFEEGFIRLKNNQTASIPRYYRKIFQRIAPLQYEVFSDEMWNEMRNQLPPDLAALSARAARLEARCRMFLKNS